MPEVSASGAAFLGFVVDDSDVQRMLDRAGDAVSGPGLSHYMRSIVDPYLRQRASERFQSEGDAAVGGAWAPLAESTVAIRESLGYGGEHPINVRTTALEQHITGERGRVHVGSGQAILSLPGSARRGTLKEKLRQAQQGSPQRRSPARPVLGLDSLDLQFALGSLDLWMTGMIAGPVGFGGFST